MNKIQSGSSFIFTDEASKLLESQLIKPPEEVTVLGTVGEYKAETLASLFQIAPALYGRIYGLTQESLKFVANKFDTGGTSAFAKGILDDQELFEELIEALVEQELIRQEQFESEKVYFPTGNYLKHCQLLRSI